jgi:hypothetical protein
MDWASDLVTILIIWCSEKLNYDKNAAAKEQDLKCMSQLKKRNSN